ncbi:hypothetical protein ACTXT7_017621, partial [Hymenolepis weldensis]
MEPNPVGRHRRSSISYTVYPRQLNNNGLKSLDIGICIDSKALCPSLLTMPNTILVGGNFTQITVGTSVGSA